MMKQEKSPESLDQLYSFFCRGKLDEVVAFFDGMSEEKRAEYKPYCLDWCNRINETIKRHQAGEKAPFFQRLETWPHEALKTGILGLVAVADWKAVRRWSSDYLDLQASVKVIASRKPSWTLDMLEGVSRRNPFYYEDQIVCWRMYRQLVKEGSCQSRWSSLMTCFMFEAMYTTTNDCISQSSWKPLNHHGIPILRQLLEDEELITDGIPKLFEMERFPTSWTLTSHDYYHRWKDAIVELIRMNRLETKRVIQWCRTALNRNYTDHQNRWYIELLDRIFKEGLASFDIAMAVDFCKYSSATPKLFGLRRIEELFRSGSNHDEQILSIIPYFLRERKFWAQKGLAILRKIGKRNAKVRSEMLQILMDGTGHPEPAVQEKSIHLLDDFNGWTDKRIPEQLKSVVEQLPSSVKQ
ncbi:MAG: DUF6493 family protein, partial [Thermoguttaceae bacterium]|nr:DUF6493 family protein [Thermoguttaceae bacterium]